MELMVGLTIMTIFMGMFTGAAVMMYNSTSKAEAIGETASQLGIAFSRLDTSIRYASAIGQVNGPDGGGNIYVAWQSTYTGTAECTQLKLDAALQQLRQRTWTPLDGGQYTNLTGWIPLASGVTAGSTAVFARNLPTDEMPHQQLAIYLTASAMSRSGPTTSISDVTFTAFNSSAASPSDVCTEVPLS